jgi:ribosomal protein S18 acetylase RimI-like enzyme
MPEDPILRIRSLRPEEHPRLLALWSEAGLPCRPSGRDSAERVGEACSETPDLLLVAEAEGRLVGAVVGSHDGRKGWVNRVAVSPAWRRRGIASRLVRHVESALARRGIHVIGILIEEENAGSRALFRALGYEPHAGVEYLSKRRSMDD